MSFIHQVTLSDSQMLGQMFEASIWVDKLTVKALPEDGDKERRNASKYESNSVTWCVKDSALNVGVTGDTINYNISVHTTSHSVRMSCGRLFLLLLKVPLQ
jgi:hypothetical protein